MTKRIRTSALVSVLTFLAIAPLQAQEYKVGIVGLRHGHVFGNLPRVLKLEGVKVVGVAEEMTILHPHVKKIAPELPLFDTMDQLLSETKSPLTSYRSTSACQLMLPSFLS